MNLLVCHSLLLNVFLDLFFIAVQTHSINIVPGRPEVSTPEKLLDFRVFQKDLLGGDTLCDLSYFRRRHHWNGLNQKMDMIFVGSYFHKMEIVCRGELNANIFQCLFH